MHINDGDGPDHTGNGLDNGRQLTVPETLEPADAVSAQRDGNRQAFRKILDPDPDGQRNRPGDRRLCHSVGGRTKEHTHCQPLRDVVECDGQDQQGSFSKLRLHTLRFLLPEIDVQMRHVLVQKKDEHRTRQETHRRRQPFHTGHHPLRHLDRRIQKRPETCRDHHTARETQHNIQYTAFDVLEKEDQ